MKKYDHTKIEKKWQKAWARKKVYKTNDPSATQEKFYVLDMFPYPSGEGLHVGPPKGYIATDVVSRMKRMQGFNVLHPMGFDAFGLPAENYAIKMKLNPEIAVKKNVARYKKQLEILGFDYDWSREVNTTDPDFYRWTQWIFLQLYKKGLAKESYEPIDWCPKDKTGLAKEDIEDGKCERCGTPVEKKLLRQWVLEITKYADRLLTDIDTLDWPESIKESQRNWIGRSEGAEIEFSLKNSQEKIKVFTTRVDTLFGVTYVVLAPEHPLVAKLAAAKEVTEYVENSKKKTEIDRTDAKREKTGVELKGVKAINPATKEEVPVWVADYVLTDYGTGAVMAVPAHDERDYEFAKKYKLPIKEVIEPVTGEEKPNEEFRKSIVAVVENPKTGKILCLDWTAKYGGILLIGGGREKDESPADTALREVREETGYKNLKVIQISGKSHHHYFAFSKNVVRNIEVFGVHLELIDEDRETATLDEHEKNKFTIQWLSKDEVEREVNDENHALMFQKFIRNKPYTGDGILTNSGGFDGKKSQNAKKEIAEKFGKITVKYKLRDWVFARQRYWGEPIPVIHCEKCGTVPVPEKDLPVKLPKVKSYEPTGTGESPLAAMEKWVNVKCPVCKGTAKRETNTMPQWAGSSWYYFRYMDPKNKKALVDPKKEKYWSPVDLYVGGAEHATRHLIYARFWHKFLYDIGAVSGTEPFKRLQSVGLIMAEDGRKMSKRYGNVVNPDDIVKLYGADTLRMYEMFMGPFDQAIAWSTTNMIGTRRFIERVWNLQEKVSTKLTPEVAQAQDKIIHKAIKKVSEDISLIRHNTAVSTLMITLNELEKHELVGQNQYETLLKILAPFAPHVTDELWALLGHKTSLHKEKWPVYDPSKVVETEVRVVVQINGKVRAEMTITPDTSEALVKDLALTHADVQKWVAGKEVKRVIYVKNKLINIVITP